MIESEDGERRKATFATSLAQGLRNFDLYRNVPVAILKQMFVTTI